MVAPVLVKVKTRLAIPSSVTEAGDTARVMRGSSLTMVPVTAEVVPMV